jgi:hypothetical protein
VLVDQAMHAHFRTDYQQFEQLTRYPKFCHGLGQFQKNPRAILSVPVEKGIVNQEEIEKTLPDGMELFAKEVVDFFQQHMQNINPTDFFEKLGILHFSVYTFHKYQHKKDKFSYLSQNFHPVVGALKLYISYFHSPTCLPKQ